MIAFFATSLNVMASSFFVANGDINFLNSSESSALRTCNHFDCNKVRILFDESAHLLEQGATDQKIKDFLRSSLDLGRRDYKRLLKYAQYQGYIDSVQYLILSEIEDDKETFSLRTYELKLHSTRDDFLSDNDLFSTINERKFRKRVKPLKDYSARQRLYLLYTPLQMKQMAKVIDDSINVILAQSASVNVDFDGDGNADRIEELSAQEIYRLGLKILKRDYLRLKSSNGFRGTNLTLIDCLSAALEVGSIDKSLLDEVLNIEELNILEKSFFKRHSGLFKSLLKIGAFSIPGLGAYVGVAIVLTEVIVEGRKDYDQLSEDHLF